MAGIGHSGMVEQVSGGARPRRGASRCHRGEPVVVTENSLLLCAVVPPSTRICCWRWPQSLRAASGCERGQRHQRVGAAAAGVGLPEDRGRGAMAGRAGWGEEDGPVPTTALQPTVPSRFTNSCTGPLVGS
uniref:Uncharacterized protein n=1 Tax=Myotis myotis TaxID=51298 RepID=A0A7J7ZZ56_MYOMY|nr:hypothetical protein mMyoMyo1_009880 [Myotis myotis]